MASLLKVVQVSIFTISAVLFVIFLYVLLASVHDQSIRDNDITSVWQSFKSPQSSSRRSLNLEKLSGAPVDSNNVIVTTKYGKFVGLKQEVLGNEVSAFLGIPYASPPLGKERFRRSIPSVVTRKLIDARHSSCKCVRVDRQKSTLTDISHGMCEDCLKINVWTPTSLAKTSDTGAPRTLNVTDSPLKSVMMWIHSEQSAAEADGAVLASYGDVVTVTFDYRVGPLGFINLHSDRESGNQGLYDQTNALRWVKNNIRHFGGDPDSVTLMGESSGALYISLLMMSPISSKYFTRAILHSGSAFIPHSLYQQSVSSIPAFVSALGCMKKRHSVHLWKVPPVKNDENSEYDYSEDESAKNIESIISQVPFDSNNSATGSPFTSDGAFSVDFDDEDDDDESTVATRYDIDCLKSASVDDIITVTRNLQEHMYLPFPPALGDDMIPFAPSAVAESDLQDKRDSFHHIKQVLLGTSANISPHVRHLIDNATEKLEKDEIRSFIQDKLQSVLSLQQDSVDDLIDHQFGHLNTTDSNVHMSKLMSVINDVLHVCPVHQLADLLVSIDKTVYMYQLNDTCDAASAPCDEIPLVFGVPLINPLVYSGKDVDLSKRLMDTWSNFARTGTTTPQLKVRWPEYESMNTSYMILNSHYAQLNSKASYSSCESYKVAPSHLLK